MFLRFPLVQDVTITAGGAVRSDDLPVNPLSVILLTIRALSATANEIAALGDVFTALGQVEVIYKGQAIVSATIRDLYAMACVLGRYAPFQPAREDAANGRTSITVPIQFGRHWYDRKECFPAVRRGELQLRTTPGAAFSGIASATLQVETIELLDGAPERFLKYTTISKTPTATGDHDVDLPLGNPILGALLFGTSVPDATDFDASFGQLRVLVDNVEHGYALTNWETLHAMLYARAQNALGFTEHFHRENAAAAYTQNAATDPAIWTGSLLENYAWLDYDPMYDRSYLLETAGKGRVHLRINADVADAIRILPVEEIAVQGGTPA